MSLAWFLSLDGWVYRGFHPDSQVDPEYSPGGAGAVPAEGRWKKLSMSESKEHIHLRFQAVVIASQLPENTAEALLVLDYARHLVVEFSGNSSGVSDSVSGTIETQPLAPPRVRARFTVQ